MSKEGLFVIVLDAGQVLEEGAPDELIASGGWFAQLAQGNKQAANGEHDYDETGEGEEDGEEVEQ